MSLLEHSRFHSLLSKITLREGSLREPFPTNENGIGWVQIQQKSLRWEENIQGSPIITGVCDLPSTEVRQVPVRG